MNAERVKREERKEKRKGRNSQANFNLSINYAGEIAIAQVRHYCDIENYAGEIAIAQLKHCV